MYHQWHVSGKFAFPLRCRGLRTPNTLTCGGSSAPTGFGGRGIRPGKRDQRWRVAHKEEAEAGTCIA
eukprot:1195839-Prorocentrum_minimum.AAC.2